MAFWGTEVKPGKPITHSSEYTSGRLRISQATLAIGEATKKSIVQCNVGKRSPVLLCVLLPNQTESCHLDLEFEESDDVVFSVIGPRSVYLTGYYVRKFQQSNLQSDTESFGVDIENSQNEGSSYRTDDDDEYEDSFINDDNELEVSPQSPVASSEEMDEITSENDKPKNKKSRSRQLKKKYRVMESDSEAKSLESEDEDAYTLSTFKSKRAMKSSVSHSKEKNDQVTEKTVDEAKDDGTCGSESNQEADPLDINDQSERETKLPMHEGTRDKNEKNEVPKEVQSDDDNIISNEVLTGDRVHGNNSEDIIINQNLPITNEKDQMQSLELEKPKKKRRRSLKDEKTSEIDVNKDHSVHGEYKEHQVEPSTNIIKPEPLANGKKKAKKKMKKTQGEDENQQTMSTQDENQIIPEVPMQNMTLPNGLIIEELASGLPNGKVAALGKTVKIYYTGMLKDSGHVFDSNMGKTAFKFRLGDEEYIDGWKVGIDGMRVGDKRRLIIPPHLGFGDHGVEGKVPPSSWLVYDVELVSVRR